MEEQNLEVEERCCPANGLFYTLGAFRRQFKGYHTVAELNRVWDDHMPLRGTPEADALVEQFVRQEAGRAKAREAAAAQAEAE